MIDLQLAIGLADIADAITLKYFRGPVQIHMKSDLTPVTNVDIQVQERLAEYLEKELPYDGILAEEAALSKPSHSTRCWIIDPLDHTSNFIRGIKSFATLICLESDGEPIVSVVSAPALRRRWWATTGSGAYSDNGKISVSMTDQWPSAYMSFAAIHKWDSRGSIHNIADLASTAEYTTGSGGFLAHMQVAEGEIDASLDPWGEPWDNAAIRHIVEEAGGRFTDVGGSRTIFGGSAIVTNGKLHAHVIEELSRDRTCKQQ